MAAPTGRLRPYGGDVNQPRMSVSCLKDAVPFQGNRRSKVSPLAAIAHAHGIWLALSALATACPVMHADVHSEHLFSFTGGTDIGTPWQAEGELEAIGRIVARPATTVMSTTASLKHRLSESFGLAPSTTFARFDIFDLPAALWQFRVITYAATSRQAALFQYR